MPESVEDMKDSWFFDENFNGLSDEFFDEVNFFDFQMDDLEPSGEGDVWNTAPQPTMDSFSASSSAHCGRRVNTTPKLPKYNFKDEGTCSQVSVSAKTSPNRSILLDKGSSDLKPSQPPRTSSPISVLESGNSCSTESGKSDFELTVPVAGKLSAQMRRPRSKRPRPSTVINPWHTGRSAVAQFNPDPPFSKSIVQLNKRKEKKKNLSELSSAARMYKAWVQDTGGGKKCTHCEVTKTPQWREGPLGPKSLCNACGVRYRSGRLFPEYRPAASPSFVAALHSNSHRKVTEMRNKGTQMKNKEILPQNK